MERFGCKSWSDFSGPVGNSCKFSHSRTSSSASEVDSDQFMTKFNPTNYILTKVFLPFSRGKKARSLWYFVHWMLGTIISLAGIINIYTGLKAYSNKTSRSTTLWTVLFTAEVSFIAFFYLFQDKWLYMQKQGVILGNLPITLSNQEIPERLNQKELLPEPCGKRNALRNLFDWYGLLYDLFVYHFSSGSLISHFVFWCLHFMQVESYFAKEYIPGVHVSKGRVRLLHPICPRIYVSCDTHTI